MKILSVLVEISRKTAIGLLQTIVDYYHQKLNVRLPHEFPNDLRLKILGRPRIFENKEISGKSLNFIELLSSV